MASDNPFTNTRPDLGSDNLYGYSSQDVTDNLLHSQHSTGYTCYVCTNPAHYKYVAKHKKYESATIQNGLYVCKHCISLAPISPKHYGIKEL